MKICPNCGKQSEDGALFCGECGFSFANAPAAPAQPEVTAQQQPAPVPAPEQGAYTAPEQGSYTAPEQGSYTAPEQGSYTAPEQGAYTAPGQGSYTAPEQGGYTAPEQGAYAAGQGAYAAGQGAGTYDAGQGYTAPAYATGIPAEGGKKKSKLPLIIGICVAAVAVIGVIAFAVSRILGGSGSTDFVGSQQAFISERTKLVTDSVAKESFSSDITISGSVTGRGEEAEILSEVLEDSSIVLKLDSSSKQALMSAAMHLKGSNVLEAFLKVTQTEFGFAIPNADDTYYFGNIEDLADTMGVDASAWTEQTQIDMKALVTDVRETGQRYVGVLSKNINKKNIKTEKRDVKLSEVGKTVKCTVMTWTPDEDELIALFEAFADTLETDEQLADILDVFAQVTESGEDGLTMLEDAADELRDQAEDLAAQWVDGEFTWTVALDSKKRVSLISIFYEDGELVFERAIESDKGSEAFYFVQGRSESFMILNDYTIKGETRKGELTLDTYAGAISLEYDVDFSKKSVFGVPYGTYYPDFGSLLPGIDVELTVAGASGGSTDHTIIVSGLSGLTYEMFSEVEILVNTTEKSSYKDPDCKYEEDISDYDEFELYELMDELMAETGSALMESPEIMDLLEGLGLY